MSLQLQGSMTALITPFQKEGPHAGKVDEKAFQDFVAWQIDQGTEGVIPCGTTGESATLSFDEHMRVVALCLEVAKGKVPVIAGTGSNDTEVALRNTLRTQELGADAALMVMPYYNKPTQEGLYQHFKYIHDQTEIPIVLYNVPGRTVSNLSVETMARLAELPRIIGIKDATGDLERPMATRLACGDDFWQLSGEDATVIPFLAQGGHGCISVTSNIAPQLCSDLHKAWRDQDLQKVETINKKLFPLHKAMFCETSPAPAKYAASLLGLSAPTLRRPLCELSDAAKKIVEDAMASAGLLTGTSSGNNVVPMK